MNVVHQSSEFARYVSPNYSAALLSRLYDLQFSRMLCDVIFTNDETSLFAHSCLLTAVSPILAKYICSQKVNDCDALCKSVIIPITFVTKMIDDSRGNCFDCLSNVINFVYTGSIQIDLGHFHHIVNMSCNLEINELIDICQKSISETPAVVNNYDDIDDTMDLIYKVSGFNKRRKEREIVDKCSNNSTVEEISENLFEVSSENIKPHVGIDKLLFPSEINGCGLRTTTKAKINEIKSLLKTTMVDEIKNNVDEQNIGDISLEACVSVAENNDTSKLFCVKCCSHFDSTDSLIQHNNEFHKWGYMYNCIYCEFKTNSLKKVVGHLLKTQHSNKCCICLEVLKSKKEFFKHCRNHLISALYTCCYCNKEFRSREKFKVHLKSHSELEISFTCSRCRFKCCSKAEMKIHIFKKHNDKVMNCDFCSYQTKYSSYLKRHMLKHNKKLMYCTWPNCNFQTVWSYNLKEHFKSHEKKTAKEFSCMICNAQFSLRKNLQRHIFHAHIKTKVFKCPECKYSNKRFDKIKAHCQSSHDGNKAVWDHLNKQLLNESFKDYKLKNSSFEESVRDDKNEPPVVQPSMKTADLIYPEDKVAPSNHSGMVYLNETTGNLTFFCDKDGEPLKGVPDVITVHSIGSLNSANNFDVHSNSDSTGMILNETTGELTYTKINFEHNIDCNTVEKQNYSNPEIAVTVLDETTGEITSKQELRTFENDNIIDFDNIFDTIDFDAMNDDSLDGFDDFDNELFDAEFSVGSAGTDMERILNEFTGELFVDESACRFSLNKEMDASLWESSGSSREKTINPSKAQPFTETFLNEVTGELTDEFSSLIS